MGKDLQDAVKISEDSIFGSSYERMITLRTLMDEQKKRSRLVKIRDGNVGQRIYSRLVNWVLNTFSKEYDKRDVGKY